MFLQDAPLGPGDRVLAGLSVAFDASCEEMWLAWRHGACLVPAPRSLVRSGMDLGPWLVSRDITRGLHRAHPGRAVARRGARAGPAADLRRRSLPARTGRAPRRRRARGLEHLRPHRGHRRGLRRPDWTATARSASGFRWTAGTWPSSTDGTPVARRRDRRAGDRRCRPGPLPRPGQGRREVRADAVSPRLGAAPTAAATWCAWNPTACCFQGRADDQVKLGGRRIELGEVDAALLNLPGVTGGAAAVRRTASGTPLLVGYVASADPDFDVSAARAALAESLPAALVPRLVARRRTAHPHLGQGGPQRAALAAAGRGCRCRRTGPRRHDGLAGRAVARRPRRPDRRTRGRLLRARRRFAVGGSTGRRAARALPAVDGRATLRPSAAGLAGRITSTNWTRRSKVEPRGSSHRHRSPPRRRRLPLSLPLATLTGLQWVTWLAIANNLMAG